MSNEMTRRVLIAPLLVVAISMTACTNALYFYEKQNIAVAIEGKPDPNQPVSGTFGAKARTAVVVPKKKDGEAGSMISMFRVKKEPQGVLGKVTLTSMLVTGDAAHQAALSGRAGDVAVVMAGAKAIATAAENASTAVENVGNVPDAEQDAFRAIIAKCDWTKVTDDERKKLGDWTKLKLNFDETNYKAIAAKLSLCDLEPPQ